ncbi:hypothetical protein DFH28DRAFT_826896, partial [Melampsora americana]
MLEAARVEEEGKQAYALHLKEQLEERSRRAGSRDPGTNNNSSTNLPLVNQ